MERIQWRAIGADVETFLWNPETGEVVSSEGITMGSKYDPFLFDENDPFFTTSLDNVLTEFTIRPARTAQQFRSYLNKSLAYIRSSIPKGLDVLIKPSANLDVKYLQTEQARAFGCEPDFNAHEMAINPRPFAEDLTLRSAGGHIHISYDTILQPFKGNINRYKVGQDDQRAGIVKSMDLHIGIPLVLMEPDNARKLLYGKAGAYRPKKYGLEYRTPSNYYLTSDATKEWAFNAAVNSIEFINNNGFLDKGISDVVRNTIDNNDKQMARELIKDFNLAIV